MGFERESGGYLFENHHLKIGLKFIILITSKAICIIKRREYSRFKNKNL